MPLVGIVDGVVGTTMFSGCTSFAAALDGFILFSSLLGSISSTGSFIVVSGFALFVVLGCCGCGCCCCCGTYAEKIGKNAGKFWNPCDCGTVATAAALLTAGFRFVSIAIVLELSVVAAFSGSSSNSTLSSGMMSSDNRVKLPKPPVKLIVPLLVFPTPLLTPLQLF